ncbi:MAG: ABC transporter permease [Bryobacteraceae bacterium]
MLNALQDLRYALRQFRRSPVFTLTAIVTLALGIGGTTAIFTLVHSVMLRSLPVADPASLYRIGDNQDCCVEGGPQDNWGLFSYALYKRLGEAVPEFEQLAAFSGMTPQFSVRRGNLDRTAKPLEGEFVTGNYFSTFGIRSFAGRTLTPDDDKASSPPVAVLSYRIWQQAYGSDPSIVGSTFIVEGHPFTIVGISPPGFFGETLRSDPPDLWIPLQQEPLVNGNGSLLRQNTSAWLRVIGRLRPGATTAGLPARLSGVLRRWLTNESGYPAEFMPEVMRLLPKQYINVIPAGGGVGVMKEDYGNSLRILLTTCGLVLLIACANVANLLLARGVARRSNTSVRMALGASRGRLIRQSLSESILLSVLGGVAGIAVAYLGARFLLLLAFHSPHFIPIDADPSAPVLAFTFGLSLITGVLFGTAPAWFASHTDPAEALRGVNRSTADSTSLSQRALLILQAALSVVLLAGAGLLTRSLSNLERQDFGFKTDHRISVAVQPLPAYTEDQLRALYRRLKDRLSQVAGVKRVGLAQYGPFTDNWNDLIYTDASTNAKLDFNQVASFDKVSAGYLETIGQPILRGRTITEQDNETSRPIAVVNETFARRFFPGKDPIGHHFGLGLLAYSKSYEIVGVVHDAKYVDPADPARPMFFAPLAQHVNYKEEQMQKFELRSHFIESVVLLVDSNSQNLEPGIRKAVSDVDPDLTILGFQTMQRQVAVNFDQQRAVASLTGLFGIVALILAVVGLYGVTAYTVAPRTSEIGVRMALGADRMNVVRLVLRGAFLQIAIGLALGIPAAIGAGKLLASQLYQVRSWDPAALLVSISALGICAFMATLIPAQRAASIDPMKALRTE